MINKIIIVIILVAVLMFFSGRVNADNEQVLVNTSENRISIIHLNDMEFKNLYIGFYNNNLIQDYSLVLLENNIYPRGFVHIKDGSSKIYINKDCYFFDDKDYQLLIKHEYGHVAGRDHELIDIMSSNAIIRYLTS